MQKRHIARAHAQPVERESCGRLLDPADLQLRVQAGAQAAPLYWDGTDEGLPEGWDAQFEELAAKPEARTASQPILDQAPAEEAQIVPSAA